MLAAATVTALGARPAASQGRRISFIRDAETEALLRAMSQPLFRAAGVNPGLVRLGLINDRAINAFVTTGNRMFLNTGLLQTAAGAEEVVGVLAHETGHVAGGHIARLPDEIRAAMIRSIATMLAGMAAAASGAGGNAGALAVGGQALAMRDLTAFTRTQENSADRSAIDTLTRLNWPVDGLLSLFQRLVEQEILLVDRQDPYVRTHPVTRDRVEFVQTEIARGSNRGAALPAGFADAFALVQAKLDGFLDPPATTARKRPGNSEAARYARAVALFRQGRGPEAVAEIDRLVASDPGSPWFHELRGQVLYETGRPAAAVPSYREAARLAPGEPLIRVEHGRALADTNDPALLGQAVAELETGLRFDRTLSVGWRSLASVRARRGEEGLAALASAEAAALEGRVPDARRLAVRAQELLPAGPARLRAQDLSNFTEPRDS